MNFTSDISGKTSRISLLKNCVFSMLYTYNFSNISTQANHFSSETSLCRTPVKDIVFHKTHKTSSTSIQNIMLRYAKSQNLTVILPNEGHHLNAKGIEKFQVSLISDTLWYKAGLQPNVFCLHNIWNGQEVKKLYGAQRPFYFSILRYVHIS